jgi:hypothetical protein
MPLIALIFTNQNEFVLIRGIRGSKYTAKPEAEADNYRLRGII